MPRGQSDVLIDALIDALGTVNDENLLALDDTHLSQFSNLCLHWRQLAEHERKRRARKKR
jgi:hypothetical protein